MDASAYAVTHSARRTRETFALWRQQPGPVVRRWVVGSVVASTGLLFAVWVIARRSYERGTSTLERPPFSVGGPHDVVTILGHNLLVLALHAMACVAGFIAGSSIPLQAEMRAGTKRRVHELSRTIALACVAGATIFSLCWQAYELGTTAGIISYSIHASPALLLVGLLPHAMPELVALFLPLAAWIAASRRDEWDQLLAAAAVTVAIAVPILVVTAVWEVYVAPHLLSAILGYRLIP
jgi:phage tail protein X